ncbi:MAG TPA: TonB-dependent receptor plug domain-containing protein, partial [Rhodanobacter sp.]|nr:TonB-dependent receptor plug domain-containing protein [Rhodanobacter sp.]
MNQRYPSRMSLAHKLALRPRMLATACSTALLLALSSPMAAAQEVTNQGRATPPPSGQTAAKSNAKPTSAGAKTKIQATELSQVIVTGITNSIANALKVKENSNDIVEVIAPEDLGKLPDVSIADSLARLPGLATQRVDGQANAISVRGLSPDFAGTTLDGREQATIGENRGVEYDQYPSELIYSGTVYKTPDASLVGQGLSGTVDLRTINPLDLSKRTLVFNLRGEHNSDGNLNPGT